MIFFAGGDVGGCRALLPIIYTCEEKGLSFKVLEHGHIVNEAPGRWEKIQAPCTEEGTELLFKQEKISCLVFSSSVHDILPLSLARKAREKNIPVIHILDHWSNYSFRLKNDGLDLLLPDHYTLIDKVAYREALKEGLPENILTITGQPAFSELAKAIKNSPYQKTEGPLNILFVSEPVEEDQKEDKKNLLYRGYTEKEVLTDICLELQSKTEGIFIKVLPHPREDRNKLLIEWEKNKGQLRGEVLDQKDTNGRKEMLKADALIGMGSQLLYEAWLTGRSVLSYQPNLKKKSLALIFLREGIFFTDKKDGLSFLMEEFISSIKKGFFKVKEDLEKHKKASTKIINLISNYL